MYAHPFGQALRRARQDAGLSQRDLAEAAEISRVYVAKLESGEARPPGEAAILRLCAALGQADSGWWIRLAGKIPSGVKDSILRCSPEALELVRVIPDLSHEQLRAIRRWLRQQ